MRSNEIYCFACREPVKEDEIIVNLADRICHEKCFKCQICQQPLDSNMFCSVMGDIYCARHHPDLGGRQCSPPRRPADEQAEMCFICDGVINEPDPLRGPFGHYHGGCFRCAECRKLLDPTRYKVVKGNFHCDPLCSQATNLLNGGDHIDSAQAMFTPIQPVQSTLYNAQPTKSLWTKPAEYCYHCSNEVNSKDQIHTLERVYHRDCFKCKRCNQVLSLSRYDMWNEFPCCQSSCVDQMEIIPVNNVAHVADPALKPDVSIEMAPRMRLPSNPPVTSIPNVTTVTPNPDRVARLQRKLQAIQAAAQDDLICHICGKKAYPAEQLHLFNKIFHLHCFRCNTCKKILSGTQYKIVDGEPYCIPHYRQLIATRGDSLLSLADQTTEKKVATFKPNVKIIEEPIVKEIPIQLETPIIENEDEIFTNAFDENPCYACGKKVYQAEQLNILSRVYHRTCFRCTTCQNLLDMGRFGVINGKPYCNPHHRQALNIKPEKVSALEGDLVPVKPVSLSNTNTQRKYNNMQANGIDQPLCSKCHQKVYPVEQLNALKKTYHKSCFKCFTCDKLLELTSYCVLDNQPYCKTHYKKAFLDQRSSPIAPIRCRSSSMSDVTSTDVVDTLHIGTVNKLQSVQLPRPETITHINDDEVLQNSVVSKTRCFDCGKYTEPSNAIIFTDRVYHMGCMKCSKCEKSISRWNYKEANGLLYCPKDFAEVIMSKVIQQPVYQPKPINGPTSNIVTEIH